MANLEWGSTVDTADEVAAGQKYNTNLAKVLYIQLTRIHTRSIKSIEADNGHEKASQPAYLPLDWRPFQLGETVKYRYVIHYREKVIQGPMYIFHLRNVYNFMPHRWILSLNQCCGSASVIMRIRIRIQDPKNVHMDRIN